jgi:N-acetylneuraminic acid mutarotase
VAVAEVNGKVYVLGGFSSQGEQINEEYDPATDTGAATFRCRGPLNHAGAAGLNGKLYLIGGYTHYGAVADTYEYDPVCHRWRTLADADARGAPGRCRCWT